MTEGNDTTSVIKDTQCRKWFITKKDYTEEDEKNSMRLCNTSVAYIFCIEIGEKKNRAHMHLYIRKKSGMRFSTLKKLFGKCKIEKAKGTDIECLEYCRKGGNYETNIIDREAMLLAEYDNIIWKPWQQDILDLIETKPDRRTINWFWEENGNIGKSFLAGYIDLKYNAVIADGKEHDICNQVKIWMEENLGFPQLVILDIPRCDQNKINYSILEKLKNGRGYSGKYEGGKIRILSPHIVVFANREPDKFAMSKDRWNIIEIKST